MMLITILTYLIKFYLWGCIASCTMFINYGDMHYSIC